MENRILRTDIGQWICYIMFDMSETGRINQMGNVGLTSGAEIVDADHLSSYLE